MTDASDLERFYGYVRAFELAYLSDQWALLEPHLTEDARHVVHGGGVLGLDDRGRAATVGGLRRAVEESDRRFDVRIPEVIEGPELRPDGVWMRFSLTLRRAGLPELRIVGEHRTEHAGDGRIRLIEERLAPGVAERVAAYFAEHGAALRPAGPGPAPAPSDLDRRDLEAATARSLARCYGAAKSRADVGAALAVCSDDFVLETLPFGTRARGRAEVAAQLAVFFRAFPDYAVTLEGFAVGEGVLTSWGRARLSFRGEILGHAPTGKTADLPVFCLFGVEGGALRSERFYFDRAELCEQIGLPLPALTDALAALRPQGARRDG
jgi:hypothetical protein